MNATEFFNAIKTGALHGPYYLYGEEPYSRIQALSRAPSILQEAGRELNRQTLKAPLYPDLVNACETLPFFDERRLVIAGELDGDTGAKLAGYVEKLPESTVLLIDAPGTPRKDNPLFKAMDKLGRTVEFPRMEPYRAADFVEQHARSAGGQFAPRAATELVNRVGVDLYTLENALQMLLGYAGPGNPVTVKMVAACIPPSSEATVFTILDGLIAGNRKAALTGLMDLLHGGGEPPMKLAFFFEGRIRQMLSAKQLLLKGMPDQSVAKALGGSEYAAKKTVQNAKKCTLPQLVSALDAFAAVDWRQKQGIMKDGDALLLAILQNF